MLQKCFPGIFLGENISIQFSHKLRQIAVGKFRFGISQQNLGWRQTLQFGYGVLIFNFGHGKIARCNIGVGDAGAFSVADKGN